MADEEQGGSDLLTTLADPFQRGTRMARVEVAGRLVGEGQLGAVRESSGERNSLLLPDRQLPRTIVQSIPKAEVGQQFDRTRPIRTGTKHHADENILERRVAGKEVE